MATSSANPPQIPTAKDQPIVLVVDDDTENHEIMRDVLDDAYTLHFVLNGQQALEEVQKIQPNLILLDVVMPVMGGMQCCLRLKKNPQTANIPVIFLTTKNDPQAEAFGLDLGAVDFITKPFDAEVLKLRMKHRLVSHAGDNMVGKADANREEITQIGDYELFWERHEALGNEECVTFTTKEMALLRLLVRNQGRVLTRDRILEEIWPQTYVTDRTIDSHVKGMRKKLPPLVMMLKTVYGSGYRLDLT